MDRPGTGRRRSSRPSAKLDGWKQIADYLDRSVKTAQRWEKAHGLPVRRVDEESGGTSVFAFTEEVDEWLRSRGDVVADRPGPGDGGTGSEGEGRASRWWRPAAILGSLAILLLALLWILGFPRFDGSGGTGNPVGGEASPFMASKLGETSRLAAFDSRGRRLWVRPFRTDFAERLPAGPAWLVEDLDGDGRREVVFGHGGELGGSPGPESGLYVFGPDGELLWESGAGRALRLDGREYADSFEVHGVAVGARPEGGKFVVLVSAHRPYSPSRVAIFDASGRLLGEYWHFGWVRDMIVADLDEDGSDEVLVGGNDDLLGRGFLALLEHDLGPAVGPGLTDHPEDLRPRRESRYLVFPQTAVGRVFGGRARVENLRSQGDGFVVDTTSYIPEVAAARGRPGAVFLFGADFVLRRIDFQESHRVLHRALLSEGRIEVTLEEERRRLATEIERLIP